MNTNVFKNFAEYKAFNNRNPTFRNKTLKQKRADWQMYLQKRKNRTVNVAAQVAKANNNLIQPEPRRDTPQARQARNRRRNQPSIYQQNKLSKNVLSDCLLLFAQASIDPFTKLDQLPCIPDALCIPSFKMMSKIEAQLAIGEEGVGFAAVNPWTMVANNFQGALGPDLAFTDTPLVTTASSYTLSTVNIAGALVFTNELTPFNSTSQFAYATIEKVPMRLVACGVEIEYTGQLMNQSGAITVLQNDGVLPIPLGTTVSAIKSNPRAKTCANSKDNRCYVTYYPTSQEHLSYDLVDKHVPSKIEVDPNYHPLLILISGATPGITFMVRVIAYFELQLPIAGASPSESDPIGYPAFQAARTITLPTDSPSNDLRNVLSATVKNIAKSVSGMGGTIGGAIGAAFGNPAAGSAVGSAAGQLLSSILGD